MTISPRDPNTILLSTPGGPRVIVDQFIASEAITPGHLIEMIPAQSSAAPQWRKNASATNVAPPIVALEQSHYNLGVDDDYAIGDLVCAAYVHVGDVIWGLLPSGQNIQMSEYLQSNGDGTFKTASAVTADANVAQWQSLDNIGSITELTRCRIQRVQ